MDEDLKNLTKLPWASIPELAGFRYVNRTTVSRKEEEWNQDGLVVVKDGGFLVRPRARLLITTGGLIQVFPQQHVHPGPAHRYHEHAPLHPEWEDHEHPGFFNGYNGALDLWEKLERIEMWYPVAPEVLLGEGAAWTHDGEAREDPVLAVAAAHQVHRGSCDLRGRISDFLWPHRPVGHREYAAVPVEIPISRRPAPHAGHAVPRRTGGAAAQPTGRPAGS